MGGFKQFHHFVSLAAIFKPRWWAFVTRARCFFKKVVPFTHLTLNWSCNPGERNSWSWHFLGDMLINCYSQYVLKECPVVPQVTTWAQRGKNSEAPFETSWQNLSKSASLIVILVCLVGRAGASVVFRSNIEQGNGRSRLVWPVRQKPRKELKH